MAASTFLLLPGDVGHRAHLLLQGVCAQRPSHSFHFSGQPLPVDARMTGIFTGAASSLLWFLVIGRARHSGRFSRGAWMLLGCFIGVMACDGVNSLAGDLGGDPAYASTNLTRVVTGLLSGVAVGALLSHLATITLTHRPPGGSPTAGGRVLAPPVMSGAFVCLVAASGPPLLALPCTLLLVGSALAVLWAMMSVLIALAWHRGWGFASTRQRDETLAVAFVSACILLLVLAAWRAALEHVIGPIRLP